jgi:aminoglycoside phosphotransferase (APT) family kinase protein
MSENYESVLEAARRLPADQQRQLAAQLFASLHKVEMQGEKASGKARRHFGAWDSGDERSADNERIDSDLAREYGNL